MECVRRAFCEQLWWHKVDSAASLCSVLQTLHNAVDESTICRYSGSQRARLARAVRTLFLVFAWQMVDSTASLFS
eukprot:11215662-Lingulodinium_polyedra.AAC.1